jgi:hypothetical protein
MRFSMRAACDERDQALASFILSRDKSDQP